MTTISLNTNVMLSLVAAQAVAVLGMALYFRWALRAVGLFRAAAAGKAFAEVVEEAQASIRAAITRAATQISNHDEKVLVLARQVDEVSERLRRVTPQSLRVMIDDAAGRKAAELTAQHAANVKAATAEAKMLEDLVRALTGSPKGLAAYVRAGLSNDLDPQLKGQIIAYCAARGIDTGREGGPKFGGI